MESAETINQRLIDYFGKFENGEANFRVVWSDDQIEKRVVKETENGVQLLFPETTIVKKYNYISERFILERIVPVPNSDAREMLDKKLSYEPLYVFETSSGDPLPLNWEVVSILVRTLIDQVNKIYGPIKQEFGEGNSLEELEMQAEELEKLLFGDQTKISQALAHGEAVGYGTYRRNDSRFNSNPIKVH